MPASPSPAVGAWRELRSPAALVHLDVAACGRASRAVLRAAAAHAARESEIGGYVAEAEAAPRLAEARRAIAGLLGDPDLQVALTTGAGEALRVLLDAWDLPRGARVGVPPSEYGGTLMLLRAAASRGELGLVPLPVDPLGRVDLAALPARIDGLDLPASPTCRATAACCSPLRRGSGHPRGGCPARGRRRADTRSRRLRRDRLAEQLDALA